VAGRLQLVKQHQTQASVNMSDRDMIVLQASNHTVTITDQQDGTYHVHVAMAIATTVKLFVNMDKDLPGNAGELPPVQLTFVTSEPTAATQASQ
jgi:hypothetical protein